MLYIKEKTPTRDGNNLDGEPYFRALEKDKRKDLDRGRKLIIVKQLPGRFPDKRKDPR